MDKGFSRANPRFATAKGGNDLMMLPPNAFSILAAVSEQSCLFLFPHSRNIDVDVGQEALRLTAAVHFKEIEFPAARQGKIGSDSEVACDLMIHVGVNRPVG